MNNKLYSIVFKKEIEPGRGVEDVKANLAKLFKTDAATIEKMFLRESIVIKKGLSEEHAQKYCDAVKKAGAVVYISEEGNAKEPAKDDEVGPKAIEATTSSSWSHLVDFEDFVPVEFDTKDYVLAEAGAQIVDGNEVDSANYDFKGLALAPAGGMLVDESGFVTAHFDTQHLKIKD